ncbi:ubiquinol-cytochrome c reductase iron-sulfur subunit [Marinimicrobium alkaliphilum]|uniref:ubiquinol-cytochrome c reductase iron-sulfur subunit n=1 Tax=Marinimicrobium alkaliphilum TaxID=2202654 RepID=UPI000DB9B3D9|nr:ubiquinol-cytochrome c reductase iron-sulfur subunit [Marinimicrobium alkaliphilum]
MSNDAVNVTRRRVLTAATAVVGAVGAVGAAVPFVGSWNPSARARAAGAPVRVNISRMEPGEMVTVEWRGRPVYIVRRTREALATLEQIEDRLRDPESEVPQQPEYARNRHRSIREEYLILLGLCTHFGCAPTFRPDVGAQDLGGDSWLGGFFCACHGSRFDMAGRVFRGVPAPTNLEVPPHAYEGDGLVIIGVDQEV